MSAEAQQLITKMLAHKLQQRISWEELFAHPWFNIDTQPLGKTSFTKQFSIPLGASGHMEIGSAAKQEQAESEMPLKITILGDPDVGQLEYFQHIFKKHSSA